MQKTQAVNHNMKYSAQQMDIIAAQRMKFNMCIAQPFINDEQMENGKTSVFEIQSASYSDKVSCRTTFQLIWNVIHKVMEMITSKTHIPQTCVILCCSENTAIYIS